MHRPSVCTQGPGQVVRTSSLDVEQGSGAGTSDPIGHGYKGRVSSGFRYGARCCKL